MLAGRGEVVKQTTDNARPRWLIAPAETGPPASARAFETQERLDRDRPRSPLDDDPQALAVHATALYGRVLRFGLNGDGAYRLERRTVVFFADATT